ncbi:MAG: glycosyltransferase [Pseudomonadota bacterium]
MVKLKVFVGWDSREDIAYKVCEHTIDEHASEGVTVHPLKQDALRDLGFYSRPLDAKASTEFSLTRFLTPYLAGDEGWSIFVDCDFVFTKDVAKILDGIDDSKALYVVQHDYTPAQSVKMDGKQQTTYPRKNWSSFMLFNNAHPKVRALTPKVVNSESPAYLHRFTWLDDEDIGALNLEWNFLVGEYPKPAATPACIHYTNGGPWFDHCQDVDFADEWLAAKARMESANTRKAG